MRKGVFVVFVLFLFAGAVFAQPTIQWQKCLGGSGYDYAYSIQQTDDGGFIVAGYSNSNDGDVSGNHGERDYWVVKLNSAGDLVWQKSLGGSSWDEAWSIQQTSDGGFIVAGYSESNDGDVSGHHGGYDYWVVKLDSAGDIVWQKCLGGSYWDYAYSIQQTFDGGYIVAGESRSNNGDVSGNHGWGDYWVVKLSPEDGISENALPERFAINVSPNPFNSSVAITAPAGAEIEIYDLRGNCVWSKTIPRSAPANLVWKPEESIASGVYLIRATAGNRSATKRIIYLK
ncbi:T9SS type A sorting domain-containing protein [bacterium]|nr:T9SS type A sorting domain-containing protein [bacterium]